MAELYSFPPEEATIESRDKPKGPYVRLAKKFRNFQGEGREEGAPEFVESDEDFYFDISAAPNLEAVQNLREHQGCRVLGFGNFPAQPVFIRLAADLKKLTELALEDPNNPTRKSLEEKIRAEIEAEQAAKAAQSAPKPAKEAKPAKEEKKEEGAPQ